MTTNLPTNRDLWDARDALMACSDWLRNANRTGVGKSSAMAAYNRARAQFDAVAKAIREGQPVSRPERHTPDFDTMVSGIPCGIVVTHRGSDVPAKLTGQPDTWQPAEYEPPEWFLVDRRGYRAEWLERKLTDAGRELIDRASARGGR